MGDEQQSGAALLHRLQDQVQNLPLNRDVEGRCRLVAEQQQRVVGEGHGQHHPLALPAGELVRIGLCRLGRIGQLHAGQQFNGPGVGGGPPRYGPVLDHDLGHLGGRPS